jgi:hypothetical protein
MVNDPRILESIAPTASSAQAAAIVAALEHFRRATATMPIAVTAVHDPWTWTAIREGVERANDSLSVWSDRLETSSQPPA